jgi:hypothetical protein
LSWLYEGVPCRSVFRLLVIIALGPAYFAWHRDSASRARFLRRAGGLTAFIASFFMLFVVGEPVSDPCGWRAAALIALWSLTLAALAAPSCRIWHTVAEFATTPKPRRQPPFARHPVGEGTKGPPA